MIELNLQSGEVKNSNDSTGYKERILTFTGMQSLY